MKVCVMIKENDFLDTNNLTIVGKQKDADILVDKGLFMSYEVVDVLTSKNVEDFYLQNIGRG